MFNRIALNCMVQYSFTLLVVAGLLVFGVAQSVLWNVPSFFHDIESTLKSILTHFLEIDFVLHEVSHLNISVLSGKAQSVAQTLDTGQVLLMLSVMISAFQSLIIDIAQMPFMSVLGLIGIMTIVMLKIKRTQAPCFISKCVILCACVNPGYSFFSYGVDQMNQQLDYLVGDTLLAQLQQESQLLQSEKTTLYTMHKKEMHNLDQDGKAAQFFKGIALDLMYDGERMKEKITGDLKTIRLLFHSNATHIILAIMVMFVQVVVFLLLAPVVYWYCVYVLMKKGDLRLHPNVVDLKLKTPSKPQLFKHEAESPVTNVEELKSTESNSTEDHSVTQNTTMQSEKQNKIHDESSLHKQILHGQILHGQSLASSNNIQHQDSSFSPPPSQQVAQPAEKAPLKPQTPRQVLFHTSHRRSVL